MKTRKALRWARTDVKWALVAPDDCCCGMQSNDISAADAHVKNGDPPSICTSMAKPGAFKNASTSDGVLNWGSRVSNLVLTSTVRERVGSTCNKSQLLVHHKA